jgi:hypothetical protein
MVLKSDWLRKFGANKKQKNIFFIFYAILDDFKRLDPTTLVTIPLQWA